MRYGAPWVLSVNIAPRTAAGLQASPKRGGEEDKGKGKGKGKGKEKGEGKGKSTKGYLGSIGPASAPATTLSGSQKERKEKKEKKEKRERTEEEQAAKAAKKTMADKKGKKAAASTTTEEKKARKKKKKKPQETTVPTVLTYAADGFLYGVNTTRSGLCPRTILTCGAASSASIVSRTNTF